ncbi:hypothetical protein DRJ17_02690 [Candidatus Woesearchaeota archaeon]|nr:MAG: hypothetical protein DRJ17_02690 [Candidatus Woesearchaeota archaeon]
MPTKCAVFCPESLDGIAAASVLIRMFKLRRYSYKVDFISYDNANEKFNEMTNLTATMIFVLDFSPEELIDIEKKIKALEKNNNKIVYWNSHHPISKDKYELLRRMVKIVEFSGEIKGLKKPSEKLCATDLVANRFMKADFVSQTLKTIAHDKEFWLRQDERSKKLADIIASGYDVKKLIDSLSRGVYWSDSLEKFRDEYLIKKAEKLKKVEQTAIVKRFGSIRIGFAYGSSILSSSEAAQLVIDSKAVMIAAVIGRDGKISFRRSEDCVVDLEQLAKKFGGGGNQYAAAGKINLNHIYLKSINSQKNFEKSVFYAANKIENFLANL